MQNFHSHAYALAENCESLVDNSIGLKTEIQHNSIKQHKKYWYKTEPYIKYLTDCCVYDLLNDIPRSLLFHKKRITRLQIIYLYICVKYSENKNWKDCYIFIQKFVFDIIKIKISNLLFFCIKAKLLDCSNTVCITINSHNQGFTIIRIRVTSQDVSVQNIIISKKENYNINGDKEWYAR